MSHDNLWLTISHLYIAIYNEKPIELLGSLNVKTKVISREDLFKKTLHYCDFDNIEEILCKELLNK